MRYLVTIPAGDLAIIRAFYPKVHLPQQFAAEESGHPSEQSTPDKPMLRVIANRGTKQEIELELLAAWCQEISNRVSEAVQEIKAVMARHNVAGVFVVGDEVFSEIHYCVSPTWSIASITDAGELRLHAKREEFPSLDAQVQAIAASAAMFIEFERLTADANRNMQSAVAMLGTKFSIQHSARRY